MSFHNKFCNHLIEKMLLYFICVLVVILAVSALRLFLKVHWVGIWSVIVAFSSHTHFFLIFIVEENINGIALKSC